MWQRAIFERLAGGMGLESRLNESRTFMVGGACGSIQTLLRATLAPAAPGLLVEASSKAKSRK